MMQEVWGLMLWVHEGELRVGRLCSVGCGDPLRESGSCVAGRGGLAWWQDLCLCLVGSWSAFLLVAGQCQAEQHVSGAGEG